MENQIEEVQRGIHYLVFTSNRVAKESISLTFCHKDRNGDFQNGITSEGLLQVLISRYQHLVVKDDSTENIQALLFLRQALDAMKARKNLKRIQKDDRQRAGISVQTGGQ